MERQVSTATILVIVLVALAAVIGIGFAAFSIAKGSGNEGVQEMAAQTDYASKSKFSEFNDKEVTGLMLKNFMDNNKGNHVTFIIQTRTFRNPAKSTSNRNIIMHNQGVYAVYGKQFNVEGNTAYYKIEEGTEIPKWTNEAYLLERRDGASLIYKGTFTSNADWDYTSVHSLGTPEYIEDSASFLCNLIYDNGDNIIGVIAKQKNKPGASSKESSVFAADSVLEHINKTDGGNIPLGGLVVWGESGGKQTLIREDGKAGQGFGEVGLSKDKVDTGMYDSIADNSLEEFVFEDLERTILLGYKGTSSQIKIPETVTHVKSLTSDLEGNSLAYKDNLKNVSAIVFNAGCVKIENLDLSLCPNIYSVYVSPTTTVIGGKKLNMVQMEAPRHLKAQIQACREGSVFVNDWDKKLYNCGCPSCQIAENDWVYVWDGLEIVGYVGTLPKNLEIPLGCTGLGPRALAGGQFETITFPNSIKYIGQEAFMECQNAKSIDMTACTLITEIPDKTFYNCDGIVSVKLPTSIEKIGGYAFYDCDALTSVSGCDNVLVLSDKCFQECNKLEVVTNMDKVETMGTYVFNKTKIGKTGVPKNVKKLGIYSYSHANSWGNTELVIPGSVQSIPGYIVYYSDVKIIRIEEGVERLEAHALDSATSCTDIYIPASVTYIASTAFANCSKATIHFADGSPFLADGGAIYNEDYTILIKGPQTLTASDNFVIRDTCKEIGSGAFSNCTLGSITIPNSVTKINNGAFQSVKGLKEVYLSKYITSVGVDIFYNGSVQTVILDKEFNPSGWKRGGTSFLGSSGRTLVSLVSNGNPYFVEDNGAIYWYNSSLTESMLVSVYKTTNSVVCKDDCSSVATKSLMYSNVVSLDTNKATVIASQACYYAQKMTTFISPNVTQLGNLVFAGAKVGDVYLPKLVSASSSTSNPAFSGVLNSVKLGHDVKDLGLLVTGTTNWTTLLGSTIDLSDCILVKVILKDAFYNLPNVTTLLMPPNVETIKEGAFNKITSTCIIEIPESVQTIEAGAFVNCPNVSLKAPKHLKEQNSNDRWGIPNSRITWY